MFWKNGLTISPPCDELTLYTRRVKHGKERLKMCYKDFILNRVHQRIRDLYK